MTTVLVIEDNEKNRYLMSFILRGAGYTVIEAVTGEEGVRTALRDHPDLILMDIQLPGIDGYETTRQIRASPGGATIPVIALTSYAMTGDRERALAAGCTGYIEKPINPDTILDEIRKFVR
ncbi:MULTISPECIES: response regulator [unclassified Methanoregula]|uniref:response regulator n=1 Tax=unclassified Methanoregula TaxID=2649730 RepID=UPI0009C97BFA|nr:MULTISPECIES: response regulator [unclassified Methanoregula]OPX64103.1 MAG: hybrid sensory histidine kinase BarA [Methanoregula sp. PtaB.Bin085]OPY34777.1 MAG: hybrid sensory histidine kinase BarA [Methanoregula sp. PtaU1.Bin006]